MILCDGRELLLSSLSNLKKKKTHQHKGEKEIVLIGFFNSYYKKKQAIIVC